MLPSTVGRVPEHTAESVNERIRRQMEERVARIADAGPEAIARRLEELDREWDTERTLEANAATISAVGAGMALLVDRRFALIPWWSAASSCNTPSRAGARPCQFSGDMGSAHRRTPSKQFVETSSR